MKNKPKKKRPSLCSRCVWDGLSCESEDRKRDRYHFCLRFRQRISDEAFARLIARVAARDEARKAAKAEAETGSGSTT